MGLSSLYRRPVTSATGLLLVLVLSAALLAGARLGPSGDAGGAAFTVVVEHFGVDAPEIERTITRPLEDELGSLPGLRSLRSLSDYGSSRIIVLMRPGSSERVTYLQVRDAVDRLYSRLPGSVQRPRIITAGPEARPFYIASVRSSSRGMTDLATLLEKELKPSLERIDGAGEVEVGGGAPQEIHVDLDELHASRAGLDAETIARAIQANELLAPLGSVRSQGKELVVVLSGRLGSLEALRGLRVQARQAAAAGPGAVGPGSAAPVFVTLGSVARVEYAPREPEEISRVDGQKNAVIAVKSSGGANLIELSRAIRAELARWETHGLQFDVIVDVGIDLERSLASILEAILFAVIVSALTLPLFLQGARRVLVISISIPLIGLVSAAAIAAAGFSLDTYILAGLAVGIGTMIDTGIILAGRATPGGDRNAYFQEALRIVPALLSSALTSLIVLVPLLALDLGVEAGGIREVSLALAALMAVAFVLSCAFIPPYAAARQPRVPRDGPAPGRVGRLLKTIRRQAGATAERVITACCSARTACCAGGAAAAALGVWAVATIGIDLEPPSQADTVPVHVECESGATIESVDARAAAFTSRLREIPGVRVVQSMARRGSAELEVVFSPEQVKRETLSARIRELGRSIPGGFAYLPEGAGVVERSLEIAITGEDEGVLKACAAQAAELLGRQRSVQEVVLNFKEPADSFEFRVDPRRAAAAGVSAERVAQALRWHLYGPVALKWIGGEREMDLRVMGAGVSAQGLEELSRVPVPVGNGQSVPVAAAGSFHRVPQAGKLYRLNRQRAVYLTAHVTAGDIGAIVKSVETTLRGVALAPGYAFDVGRDLVEQAEKFQTLWATFALCILLVYIVLGILTESLLWPLVILAVLPASLTLPLAIMRLSGQRLVVPVLIGLIVLSGMAVNNSILIVDAFRARRPPPGSERDCRRPGSPAVIAAVQSRLSALTATSAATVLGHIPLLFAAGEGAAFMRSLAFVIIWGIIGSYAATILLVPALIGVASRVEVAR